MAGPTAAERGREVRQRLRAAAAELVPELGWAGVSTRLLARRAGVAPGLVHYHFPSLQALLREAALGVLRDLLEHVAAALDAADGLDAGLEVLLGPVEAHTGRDPASLLVTEAYLAAARDEEMRTALTALLGHLRRDVARWLARHDHPTPDRTALVLAAALDGLLLHRALDPGLTPADVAPVLRGLLGPTTNRSTAE
jgi:AcrR family transcriptional regulator